MVPRRQVTDVLKRLAFALSLLERPQARVYSAAAWGLRSLKTDLAALAAAGGLQRLPGVGPGIAALIGQVLAGQTPPLLTELEAQIPAGLFEMCKLRGLGPAKLRVLWRELDITTRGELEYACRENRLVALKGFGKKTQSRILAGIAELEQRAGWFRRDQLLDAAAAVIEKLLAVDGIAGVELVGDFRRGCELVRALELLLVGSSLDAESLAQALGTPVRDEHSVLCAELQGLPLRIHCSTPDRAGVVRVFSTGSAAHLQALQQRAKARGLRLNEEGMWDASGVALDCPHEETLYAALGLHATAAERREGRVPLIEKGSLSPRLLRRSDLRGALHNHTLASDGVHTLEQMQRAAAERGLRYLGISEHSVSAYYAGGLHEDQLREQHAAIVRLNRAASRCTLLSGIESDILADGQLDYGPEVLAQLDFVIASVHRRFSQDAPAMTRRLEAAARNRWTTVVGHPTGRLLLGRPPSAFDFERFLAACVEGGCAVELNSSPQRLDLNASQLARAKERGLLVSLAADAHSAEALDHLDHGVSIARRAGLGPEDVLNCMALEELQAWLAARLKRALEETHRPDGDAQFR